MSQWINLGMHAGACMAVGNCGTTGGAISFWVKVIDCSGNLHPGYLTTRSHANGVVILCAPGSDA